MSAKQILDKWKQRAKNIQDRHYNASATLKNTHYLTGLPLVILAAIVSSNAIGKVLDIPFFLPYSDYITASLSLFITVLAAVQSFMSFEKRAQLHYSAGVKYGELKRKIETMEASNPTDDQISVFLSELGRIWNSLTEESEPIPLRIWNKKAKA